MEKVVCGKAPGRAFSRTFYFYSWTLWALSPYLSAEKLSAFGEQVLYSSSDATLIFFIMLEIVGCNRF